MIFDVDNCVARTCTNSGVTGELWTGASVNWLVSWLLVYKPSLFVPVCVRRLYTFFIHLSTGENGREVVWYLGIKLLPN